MTTAATEIATTEITETALSALYGIALLWDLQHGVSQLQHRCL
jgi:hypothetical protein